MSDRLNFPIWADADTNTTGFTLQHLVNGSWVDTDMRTYPMPAGYESEICLNRYVEKDIKSTAPDFSYSGTTGITPQPDAYQVYRMDVDGVLTREMGFFNDWSYEMFTGNTRCISAPINRHADARQKLVYGNFAESGNSIIVKPVIVADIKMQPSAITIGAEQYQTITIVVTSNTEFELILPAWLTASQTAFTSGTTVAYLYPQANTSFDSRQFTIQAKHDAYWGEGYEYTDLAQVAQAGKVAYLTIYPDPLGFAWDATGLTSVTVNTNTDFTATTNSSDTWFTYSGKTEVGANYYDVYFNVSANTGDYRQTHAYFEYVVDSSGGTQTRASRVVQAKAPDITIEPLYREVDNTAQGIRIQVTSETNWTATSSDSWISVPVSGVSGVSLIFVDVTNNPYYISRSGSVIFSNGARQVIFSVVQEATPVVRNVIRYSSTNDAVVTPYTTIGYGANIVSNTYYPEANYGNIVFDDVVTEIPQSAFYYKATLSSVIIPDSVTTIGTYAFNRCHGLSSVIIGSGVTTIGEGAFQECIALTSITLSSSVTYYGKSVFEECTALSSVTIPYGTTMISEMMFTNCTALSSVTIPNSVTNIGEGAFAFTSLKSVVIPSAVTTIGQYAFTTCSALTSVTLQNGLIEIGESAFRSCSALSSITIPNSVTTIGESAFGYCNNLSNINFNGTKLQWNSITKSSDWNLNVPATVVHCTNGDVPI